LIVTELQSDPFALLEPIVHDEEEIAYLLKGDQDVDPVCTELIVYEEGYDNKMTTLAQLVQEVAPSADGELNDPAQTFSLPHTDVLTSSSEEGEGEETREKRRATTRTFTESSWAPSWIIALATEYKFD